MKFISTTFVPLVFCMVSKASSVLIPVRDCPVVVVVVVIVLTDWPVPSSPRPPFISLNSNSPIPVHQKSPKSSLSSRMRGFPVVSDLTSTSTPDQFVSHSFHTVPRIPSCSAIFLNCSNEDESSTVITGRTSTSFHSSESGESLIVPAQLNTLYGFTLLNVDAYG